MLWEKVQYFNERKKRLFNFTNDKKDKQGRQAVDINKIIAFRKA